MRLRKDNIRRYLLILAIASAFIIIFSSIVSAQLTQTATQAAQTNTVQPYCPISVYEGDTVRLAPEAYDPDKEIGPAGMLLWSISPPFNATAEWKTTKGKRGIFEFWVKVSDGELSDTVRSCVNVLPKNRNPVLEPLEDMTITRGKDATFYATCSDPDNDTIKIEYFVNGKNMQYLLYWPVGRYWITAVCTDNYGGMDYDSAVLTITDPVETSTPSKKPAAVIPAQEETPLPTQIEIPVSAPEVTENRPSPQFIIEEEAKDTEDNASLCSCGPCRCGDTGDIEVVVYDTIYPLGGDDNTTKEFTLAARPKTYECIELVTGEGVETDTAPEADEQEVPAKTPAKEYAPVNTPVKKTAPQKKLKTALERKLEVNSAYKCDC